MQINMKFSVISLNGDKVAECIISDFLQSGEIDCVKWFEFDRFFPGDKRKPHGSLNLSYSYH